MSVVLVYSAWPSQIFQAHLYSILTLCQADQLHLAQMSVRDVTFPSHKLVWTHPWMTCYLREREREQPEKSSKYFILYRPNVWLVSFEKGATTTLSAHEARTPASGSARLEECDLVQTVGPFLNVGSTVSWDIWDVPTGTVTKCVAGNCCFHVQGGSITEHWDSRLLYQTTRRHVSAYTSVYIRVRTALWQAVGASSNVGPCSSPNRMDGGR